jgi:hypothetical protein
MIWKKHLTVTALCLASVACWGITFRKITTIQPDVHVVNAKLLRTLVPEGSTIGICHDLFQHADIHANFQRYHHLSLSTRIDTASYVLADSACLPQFNLKRDSLIPLSGKYFLIKSRSMQNYRR